jgi:hypothetical protein
MKTRNELYSREAAELLRVISTYKTVTLAQILRLYPGRDEKTRAILTHLVRQGRVTHNDETDVIAAADADCAPDAEMIAAFWVLLDFIERAEYHTAGEFPVKVSFFADAEMYEIICVRHGQEALVSHALRGDDPPRRIVLVADTAQIENLNIPNISGYCTVDLDGAVTYYQQA